MNTDKLEINRQNFAQVYFYDTAHSLLLYITVIRNVVLKTGLKTNFLRSWSWPKRFWS